MPVIPARCRILERGRSAPSWATEVVWPLDKYKNKKSGKQTGRGVIGCLLSMREALVFIPTTTNNPHRLGIHIYHFKHH